MERGRVVEGRAAPPRYGYVLAAVLMLFFFSGACGLIYEIVWTRLLRLVMGNTVFSITTVLCAFMGGLAAGSYLAGKVSDRRGDPLRVYAILEGSVGVYCLLLPWIISLGEPVYRLIYRDYHNSYYLFGLIRFVFCGAILLVPATFMGATLPLISRFLATSSDRFARAVGRAYAINTFGAVGGAVAAGFFLIPAIGVTRTIYVACAMNLLVAAGAYLLHRRCPTLPATAGAAPKPGPGPLLPAAARGATTAAGWIVLVGYGLSGLAALVYEVAWTRALSLSIGSTVYAFSLMLTAFILGLAIGSMALSWLVDRWKDLLRALAVVELAIGFSALAVAPVFAYLPIRFGRVITELTQEFWKLQLTEFALVAGVMLVPATLMGLAFPLAAKAYAKVTGGAGRPVGNVYAFNSLGAIVGSFLGGFVLIPALGLRGTIYAAVAVNVAVGCAILLWCPAAKRAGRAAVIAVVVTVLGLSIWLLPEWNPNTLTFGLYALTRMGPGVKDLPTARLEQMANDYKLLFHKEGAFDTITVRQIGDVKVLVINGKTDASSEFDMPTQQMVGQVPMFLHPKPESVCVIGLASGVTAGACLLHPVKQLDCVEISPDMPEATRLFADVNHNVLDDPRLRVIIADGRNHLALTDRKYDVIVSEPSNPWIAGIADLFTVEFFRLCRQRLNDGGIACIWVQSYGIDDRSFYSIFRAFAEVFPQATVWEVLVTHNPAVARTGDYLLVGSTKPFAFDCGEFDRRLADPALRADMERIPLPSAEDFLAAYMFDRDTMLTLAGSAPVHTDDNGLVEFSTPRTMFLGNAFEEAGRRMNQARSQGLKGLVVDGGDPAHARKVLDRALRRAAAKGHMANARDAAAKLQRDRFIAEFRAAVALDPDGPELKADLDSAISLYHKYMSERLADKAAQVLTDVLEIKPDHPEANYYMGMMRWGQRRFGEAVRHFARAVEARPDWPEALATLAWALATAPDEQIRDGARAVALAEEACRLDRATYTLESLAAAYAEAGQFDRAIAAAREAAEMARAAGQAKQAAEADSRRQLYESHKPFRAE